MGIKDWIWGKSPQTPAAGVTAKKPTQKPVSAFDKIKAAMARTQASVFGALTDGLPFSSQGLDEEMLETLEEILLRADIGIPTTEALMSKVRAEKNRLRTQADLFAFLRTVFIEMLTRSGHTPLALKPGRLNVIVVVGVNGAGKTTLIGKLAHRFVQQGKTVFIGAGDTFRAAADEQLSIWAQRAGATLVRAEAGSHDAVKFADPGAVVYNTLQQAKQAQADVAILDTAGRLQNKFNLMEELQKIGTVVKKELPTEAHLETLLVIDATTGQNAMQQATVFRDAIPLTGVALTKLDGSAKGGIVLAIAQEYGLSVKLVGVGEGIQDLEDFDPAAFVEGFFPASSEVSAHA